MGFEMCMSDVNLLSAISGLAVLFPISVWTASVDLTWGFEMCV